MTKATIETANPTMPAMWIARLVCILINLGIVDWVSVHAASRDFYAYPHTQFEGCDKPAIDPAYPVTDAAAKQQEPCVVSVESDWNWYAGIALMVVALCAIWGCLIWYAFAN